MVLERELDARVHKLDPADRAEKPADMKLTTLRDYVEPDK